jgi:glycosyltransferase A (GT-A) superfamily protein (DUF2064 family)
VNPLNRNPNSRTAVLIFAASGRKDALAKGMAGNGFLFDTLTQRTIQAVKDVGLPHILITDKEQRGSNFGERLTNAMMDVYAQGYQNVIAIGNDTPQLTSRHISSAAFNLDQGLTTVGPSTDGGFYLLGLTDSAFAKAEFPKYSTSFSALSWQSALLFDQLLDCLGNDVQTLGCLMDIDSMEDIKAILAKKMLDALTMQLLLLALRQEIKLPNYLSALISQAGLRLHFNKGSPC